MGLEYVVVPSLHLFHALNMHVGSESACRFASCYWLVLSAILYCGLWILQTINFHPACTISMEYICDCLLLFTGPDRVLLVSSTQTVVEFTPSAGTSTLCNMEIKVRIIHTFPPSPSLHSLPPSLLTPPLSPYSLTLPLLNLPVSGCTVSTSPPAVSPLSITVTSPTPLCVALVYMSMGRGRAHMCLTVSSQTLTMSGYLWTITLR